MQVTDFLKELGAVAAVNAAAGNADVPESLTYNSHIHFPPNFEAFETVELGIAHSAFVSE